MVWVLELDYGRWLFILFDYGHGLACSFLFVFKATFFSRVGELVILGHSFTQVQGLTALWLLEKKK